MPSNAIQVDFHFYGVLLREKEWWIAHCPPLDVASQGRTVEEAQSNLKAAVALFVESCSQRHTLFEALRELGFRSGVGKGEPPSGSFPIDVPVPFWTGYNEPCRA